MSDRKVIYGINPVLEALASGVDVNAVYVAVGLRARTRKEIEKAARSRNLRVSVVAKRELDGMSAGGVHQGVAAVSQAPYAKLDELLDRQGSPRTIIICLDGVQDPRNLGAVARSVLAFGAVGMVIPDRRSSPVTPAAHKASAGALSRLKVARVKNMSRALEKMKEAGFWISGAVAHGGSRADELDPGQKVALVLGAEGGGIRKGIDRLLDYRVQIPIREGVESLNVSVAAAILLYEWLRPS